MNFKLGTELHGFTVESVDKIEKIFKQCHLQLKYKKNRHLSNKRYTNRLFSGFSYPLQTLQKKQKKNLRPSQRQRSL